MTATAVILVIISALMHAGWNLFSKAQSPTIGFFQLATLGTLFWFSPIFLVTTDLIVQIPLALWGILIVAGLFQAIYYVGLASAYANGALSIAYPLARSLPLLFIVVLTCTVGRGIALSFWEMFGMAAIVTGAFILPMNSKKDFKFSNYYNASCAFAIVAAIGTTGYSFVDDIGMNMLKIVSNPSPGWIRALLYLLLECLFTAFWLQIIMLLTPQATAKFRAGWRRLVKPGLIAGLAIGATYGIVLLAMTHTQNVSYIVALRQLSIPIGTLLGVVILKEQGSWPRFVGVTILFLGLVLVAVG